MACGAWDCLASAFNAPMSSRYWFVSCSCSVLASLSMVSTMTLAASYAA